MIRLRLEFIDLEQDFGNRSIQTTTLIASNLYMLNSNFLNFVRKNKIHIDYYKIESKDFEAGNKGVNAGSYLYEILEVLLKGK